MNWANLWRRTGGRVLFALPESFRWKLSEGLAGLAWSVFRFRRFTLLRNVSIAFPEKSKEERIEIVRSSLVYTAFNFFEILVLPQMNQKFSEAHVILNNIEHLEAAKAKGKGVLSLCLHIGNGDYSASVLAQMDYEVAIISKRFKSQFWDKLWFGLRGAHGVQHIEAHSARTAFEILKRCKRGGIVAFVLDQFMGRPYGIPSTFFGRATGTAYGLALFAVKTGAPVVPIWTYRDRQTGKIHVCFEPEVAMIEEADRDEQLRKMTEKYNRVLEQIIAKRPEQWMWIHRRWKWWE